MKNKMVKYLMVEAAGIAVSKYIFSFFNANELIKTICFLLISLLYLYLIDDKDTN